MYTVFFCGVDGAMFHVKHHTRRRVRTLAELRHNLPLIAYKAGKPGSKAAANSGRGPPKGPRPVGGAKEGGPPHALHALLNELLRALGAQKARGSKAPRGRDEIRLRRSREQRDAARRMQATGERDERARDGRAPKAQEGGESADGHGRRHWGGPPLPAQPAVPSMLLLDRVDPIAAADPRQKKAPQVRGSATVGADATPKRYLRDNHIISPSRVDVKKCDQEKSSGSKSKIGI